MRLPATLFEARPGKATGKGGGGTKRAAAGRQEERRKREQKDDRTRAGVELEPSRSEVPRPEAEGIELEKHEHATKHERRDEAGFAYEGGGHLDAT